MSRRKRREEKRRKEKNTDPLIVSVVEYLNEKTGKKFTSSNGNAKYIEARIKENHTLEEFKTVVDKMTSAWKDDPKMQMYLRPETLFGNKFESYLYSNKTKKWNEL